MAISCAKSLSQITCKNFNRKIRNKFKKCDPSEIFVKKNKICLISAQSFSVVFPFVFYYFTYLFLATQLSHNDKDWRTQSRIWDRTQIGSISRAWARFCGDPAISIFERISRAENPSYQLLAIFHLGFSVSLRIYSGAHHLSLLQLSDCLTRLSFPANDQKQHFKRCSAQNTFRVPFSLIFLLCYQNLPGRYEVSKVFPPATHI